MINGLQQLWRILARTLLLVRKARLAGLVVACVVAVPGVATAQDTQPAEPVSLDHLPQVRHLAAALAGTDSRMDTLLTMVAVAQMLENVSSLEPGQVQAAADQFADDRAWLDRLGSRYLEIPMRSTVLDPSSWLVVNELGQHSLEAPPLVSPLGPDLSVLLAQLFDRSEERLAATILPEVLVRMEPRGVELWRQVLSTAAANEALLALVAALDADWFDPWTAAEPPAPLSGEDDVLADARSRLTALANTATLAAPPDALALRRIRFSLLTAEPGQAPEWSTEAAYVLRLAAGVENLQRHQYLSFTESLLWVTADLLHRLAADPEAVSPMSAIIADLLPRISASFAREFADVDPRLNAAIAAAYDVVQNIRGGSPGLERIAELRSELADAVAQVVLMVPDMDYYFGQPVRDRVAEEIDICISIAAARDRNGEDTLTREQFDRCLQAMVDLVDREARSAELAGDANGPFGTEHRARELELPPWQRVNYILGYMHDRFTAMCQLPARPVANPLEWATLATLMAWFAERAPVYFQTPASEALLMRMRQRGLDLLRELSRQADCFTGAGGGMNDPVSRAIQDYDKALLELVHGVREAELAFRNARLKSGADVVLGGDAGQRTSFRSEGLVITACDTERACGMTDGLEATRALVGLFPDAYLIADQSGLGNIEICYDNVRWLNRRSEPVRADDPFVANYYGHLGFELKGRYLENGESFEVFGSRFVSPDEYHYLFASVDEAILEDPCPMEHVGKRIHANLSETRKLRIVPDRLTYLSSARTRPATVLAANWSQGAEWRDWFVTGIGVTPLEFDGDPTLRDRVNQHLQSLYQAQQSMVYSALLRPGRKAPGTDGVDLYALTQEVSNRKALIRSVVSLFYPSWLLDSDDIRASLEGQVGLIDEAVLARFRDGNVPVSTLGERGTMRLETFRGDWGRLPENVRRTGAVDNSVAHGLTRLNALYRSFFGLEEGGAQAPR